MENQGGGSGVSWIHLEPRNGRSCLTARSVVSYMWCLRRRSGGRRSEMISARGSIAIWAGWLANMECRLLAVGRHGGSYSFVDFFAAN